MRKFYQWSLALFAVLFCCLSASAYKCTVKWNDSDAIKLYKNTPPNGLEDISGINELELDYTSFVRLYAVANEGYAFVKVMQKGSAITNFNTNASWGGLYYSATVNSSFDNTVIEITTKKIDRSSAFTLEAVNGADCINADLSGTKITGLVDGEAKTINFDPDIEGTLTLTNVAANFTGKSFYSVTLNDQPVTGNAYYCKYEITGLKANDKVKVQVYENEPAQKRQCVVKLEYADGLDGCLNTIRNWTASSWITPENNQFEVVEGTDVQFNFFSKDGGYNITDFAVNGTTVTADNSAYKFNITDASAYVRFAINEDITLKVNGSGATYAQIPMTAYVMNPEGVVIKAGTYTDGTPIDMSDATAITSDITLPTQTHTDSEGNVTYITPSFTLTPDNAKVIQFTIDDRKYYNAYVAPKDGWYIATLQDKSKSEISYADKTEEDCQTFYVVALPLPNDNTATVEVNLPDATFANVIFGCNSTLANNWDNPASAYKIKNNDSTEIKFTEGYQTPFSIASRVVTTPFNCVVDNRLLALADAESSISYQLDVINGSKVIVNNTDNKAYTVTLTANGGKKATYTYGELKREGSNGYNLLAGTQINITPEADCMLQVDGKLVYSPLNEINELTDGVYSYALEANSTVIVGPDSKFITITKYKPLEGQTVAEFSEYSVYLPATGNENMYYMDASALSSVKVNKVGGNSIAASGIEPQMNEDGSFTYVISFETVDDAGDYTVTIPAGFFYEAAWSDAAEDFVRVDGGASTAAFTGSFKIDPKAAPYHMIPSPSTTVNNLSTFQIVFTDATSVEEAENVVITLSGTDYSQNAAEVVVVTGTDFPTYKISFSNPPHNAGKYMLSIPAGAFTLDGWKDSEAVSAEYDYVPSYKLTPAPGSTIEDFKFTLEFPSATDVTFVGSKFDITLSQDRTWASPGLEVAEVTGATVPTFELTLNAETQRPALGQVILSINEGTFSLDGADSPYISAAYTYESAVTLDYKTDPAGSKLVAYSYGGVQTWTFIFDETVKIQNSDVDAQAKVTVNGESKSFMTMVENNMLMMGLSDYDFVGNDGDVLKVEIPAGAFSLSGTPSPAIEHSWTLVKEKNYTFTADPANNSKVKTLDKVTITFPEAETVELNTSGATTVDIKQGYTVIGKMNMTTEGNKMILTAVTPIVAAGEYKISVNPYQYALDEVMSYPGYVELTYTVDPKMSGIDGIEAGADAKVTVVSLDGRVLLENAPSDSLKTLEPGIYIVNGKKFLVK